MISILNLIVCFAFLVLAFLFLLISYFKNKKKLGNKIISTPNGFKYSDLRYQGLLVLAMAFMLIISTYGKMSELTLNVLFAICGSVFGYFLFQIYMAFTEKGFYENGFVHNVGIGLYENYCRYDLDQRKNGIIIVKIIPSKALVPTGMTYIESDQEKDVKRLIKDKCKIKKEIDNKTLAKQRAYARQRRKKLEAQKNKKKNSK